MLKLNAASRLTGIMMVPKQRDSASKSSRAKVLVIDDHPIVRLGLTQLINQQEDMHVCGEAAESASTMRAIADLQPDIVTIDVGMMQMSGIDLIKRIHAEFPDLPILVISTYEETLYAERLLRMGARGYVMKQEPTETVMKALRLALKGAIYVSPRVSARMLEKIAEGGRIASGNPLEYLSDREMEVFQLIGQGLGTREIAERLHVSIKTVESHRAHIKEKLKLKSATELVQLAVRLSPG